MVTQTVSGSGALNRRDGGPIRRIDVEDLLIWAYRDQRAHVLLANRRPGLARNATTWMDLGTTVQGGGIGAVAPRIHVDAELVYLTVESLSLGSVLVPCAVAAKRPDWDGVRRAVPDRRRGVMTARNRRAVFCWITYTGPDSEFLEKMRDDYVRWHAGLQWVADRLSGLKDHVVTGPGAPERPWEVTAKFNVGKFFS